MTIDKKQVKLWDHIEITDREVEILQNMIADYSGKEISDHLGVTLINLIN